MKKNYPKTIILILAGIALLALCAGNASAQDNTVTGKTYAIYFLTALNSNPDNFDDTTFIPPAHNLYGGRRCCCRDD